MIPASGAVAPRGSSGFITATASFPLTSAATITGSANGQCHDHDQLGQLLGVLALPAVLQVERM